MSGLGGDRGEAQLTGRAWPTGLVEHPTPREAWRALLDADAKVRDAQGTREFMAAEIVAQDARTAFADAIKRAGT